MSRKRKSFLLRLRRSTRWARRKLARAPRAVRIVGVVAILFAVVSLANLVYHVVSLAGFAELVIRRPSRRLVGLTDPARYTTR
jgi:hypothetical protein